MLPIIFGVSIIMAAAFGCAPGFFTEIFPANVRQTSSGLIMNFGTMIGGGLAPVVAQLIYDNTKSITSVAHFVTAVSIVSLIAMWKLSRDKNLIVQPV